MKTIRARIRGFTLMELLVVIALIAILVTVMVPVVLRFMSGRGLSMAGNNIAGFMAFARSEAMNTRQTHVVVFHEEEIEINSGGTVVDEKEYLGPGLALYRINPYPAPNSDDDVVNYVKGLDFSSGIGGDVDFAPRWKQNAPRGNMLDLPDAANKAFADEYKIVLRPDGRLVILEDKPGYILDTNDVSDYDADFVVYDGSRYVFIDFNAATGAVKRSTAIDREELPNQ